MSVGKDQPNQISLFLQIPIYVFGEVASIFCCMIGTEYAYNGAPKSMKSLVQAIWLAMAGIGGCLALALNPLAEDPRLVITYVLNYGGVVSYQYRVNYCSSSSDTRTEERRVFCRTRVALGEWQRCNSRGSVPVSILLYRVINIPGGIQMHKYHRIT